MSEKPDAALINASPPKAPLYPMNWPFIANSIKDKAGWQCATCHHPHEPGTGYTLTVHHTDHNTFNNSDANLIALCQRCHLIEEGKYRQRIRQDRLLNELQASGQQILPSFQSVLFPQPKNP